VYPLVVVGHGLSLSSACLCLLCLLPVAVCCDCGAWCLVLLYFLYYLLVNLDSASLESLMYIVYWNYHLRRKTRVDIMAPKWDQAPVEEGGERAEGGSAWGV